MDTAPAKVKCITEQGKLTNSTECDGLGASSTQGDCRTYAREPAG